MTDRFYSLTDGCRSCGNKEFHNIYASGPLPVAGIYYDDGSKPLNIKSPITFVSCRSCGLMQLMETINPDIYKDYSFVGNSAEVYQEHLRWLATSLAKEWNLRQKNVFEIGASNGVLLKYLQDIGENEVAGVEPSQKLCDYAGNSGIKISQGYFNKRYLEERHPGTFDCVIVRHVLEHIDGLGEMMSSIKEIMKPEGLLVVEVPDGEKMLKDKLFSNIFHEHLNYFSIHSLNNLFMKHGFNAVYRKDIDIHGGSLLLYYKAGLITSRTSTSDLSLANKFSDNATKYYASIHNIINSLNSKGKVVHGYGASHRTFILLGNAGLAQADIPVIYDNNMLLHNKRLNGLHALIKPSAGISKDKPDALVIFATSYEEEIAGSLIKDHKYRGEIISLRYEAICGKD